MHFYNKFTFFIDTPTHFDYNISMFENMLMTLMTGAFTVVIIGSIVCWILSYIVDEIQAMRGITWQEIVVMLIVCFVVGSAVS